MVRNCWVLQRLTRHLSITYSGSGVLADTGVIPNVCVLPIFNSTPFGHPPANDNHPRTAIEKVYATRKRGVERRKLVGIFMSGACLAPLRSMRTASYTGDALNASTPGFKLRWNPKATIGGGGERKRPEPCSATLLKGPNP